MDPKNGCTCEPRLSYRQMLMIAWGAPVISVIIESVLRIVR